eukprot:gene3766-699_t
MSHLGIEALETAEEADRIARLADSVADAAISEAPNTRLFPIPRPSAAGCHPSRVWESPLMTAIPTTKTTREARIKANAAPVALTGTVVMPCSPPVWHPLPYAATVFVTAPIHHAYPSAFHAASLPAQHQRPFSPTPLRDVEAPPDALRGTPLTNVLPTRATRVETDTCTWDLHNQFWISSNLEPQPETSQAPLTPEVLVELPLALSSPYLVRLTLDAALPNLSSQLALVQALSRTKNLLHLSLADNGIGSINAPVAPMPDSDKAAAVPAEEEDEEAAEADPEGRYRALRALCKWVDDTETLVSLNLAKNSFGSHGLVVLAKGLLHNISVDSLNISSNSVCESADGEQDEDGVLEGMEAFANTIKRNKKLVSIIMNSNGIQAQHMEVLTPALEKTHRLQHFEISGNELHNDGAEALAKGVKGCLSLQYLDVSSNDIGATGAIHLASAIEGHPALSTVILGNNKIGQVRDAKLDEEEKQQQEQEAADKQSNLSPWNQVRISKIYEKAAVALGTAMDRSSMRSLDITENHLGPDCCALLLASCRKNGLCNLKIDNNQLTGVTLSDYFCLIPELYPDNGASLLATAVGRNQSLRSLNVSRNFIGDKGFQALCAAVSLHPALTTLTANYNEFGAAVATDVATMLQLSPLEALDISANPVGNKTVMAIAEGLAEGRQAQGVPLRCLQVLRHLALDPLSAILVQMARCNLTDDAAASLREIIRLGAMQLDLSDNSLSASCIAELVTVGGGGITHFKYGLSLCAWTRGEEDSSVIAKLDPLETLLKHNELVQVNLRASFATLRPATSVALLYVLDSIMGFVSY